MRWYIREVRQPSRNQVPSGHTARRNLSPQLGEFCKGEIIRPSLQVCRFASTVIRASSDLILWPIFSLYKCEDYLASCMSIVATYARSTLESIIRGIIIVIYVSQLAGVITLWQLRKTPKFLRSEIRTVASTPSNQLFLFMVK